MKPVILKWKSDDGELEDVVYLMEEDDEVFVEGTMQKVGTLSSFKPDFVYFNDGEIVFAVPPALIESISDIPDDMK